MLESLPTIWLRARIRRTVRQAYHDKDQKEKKHSKDEGHLGQQLDAVVQSTENRGGGHGGNTPNGQVLNRRDAILVQIVVDPTQELESSNNVNGAKTERCTYTCDRSDNGKSVNDIAHPSAVARSK